MTKSRAEKAAALKEWRHRTGRSKHYARSGVSEGQRREEALARANARQRALSTLARRYPDEYEDLYADELRRLR